MGRVRAVPGVRAAGGVALAGVGGGVGVGGLARGRCATPCPSTPPCPPSVPSGWPRCWRGSPGARRPRSRWPSGASRWPTTSRGSPPSARSWARRRAFASTPTAGGRSTTRSRALGRLGRLGLEYAEQPCATVEELRDLRISLARNGIDVPVAADESIRKAEDPLRVRDLEAADVIVVKVAPLGGVRAALAVVEACGLPGGGVLGTRHERRHRGRGGARGRPAHARPRVRAGHGGPARRRRRVALAAAGRRRAPGRPGGRRPRRCSSGTRRRPTGWPGGANGSQRPTPSCAEGTDR